MFLQPRRKDREKFQPVLPPSLKNALDYFWMATAARRVRGQRDQHSSMLVHTTLYAAAHERIQSLLREYATARLAYFEGPRADVPALRTIWNEEMHRGPAASTTRRRSMTSSD